MEDVNSNKDAIDDPKTPMGLVFATMLLFTSALKNKGLLGDSDELNDIQQQVFKDSLEVYLGNKIIEPVHTVKKYDA